MSNQTIQISSRVAKHIEDLPLKKTTDGKLRALLEAEYRRRLSQYNMTDRLMREKYDLNFDEFERQQIVKQQGYTWEVESDAIEWDLAISGINTMQRKLAELTTGDFYDD
ncbi:MAG: hypothetical protein MAG431_00532 [Chloroflexi bacterium]|nr:hypothetical protein [Chloroflexota bacterium]